MTLVPSSANPQNLRNLIILTHGISISKDGQASRHGAKQIRDGVKTVAAERDTAPLGLAGRSDFMGVGSVHSDWLPCRAGSLRKEPPPAAPLSDWGSAPLIGGKAYGCPTACAQ